MRPVRVSVSIPRCKRKLDADQFNTGAHILTQNVWMTTKLVYTKLLKPNNDYSGELEIPIIIYAA
jgi:hypothetical protein